MIFLNGSFMLGFVGRFIIAMIILNILYAKSKNDKFLKRGLMILYITGACIMIIMVFFIVMFSAFGAFAGIFSYFFHGISNFLY